MTAWVVRAGRRGESEQHNLDRSRVTVGWSETGDLTPCATREQVRTRLEATWPDRTVNQIGNLTGQLWAFRDGIEIGDLVLLPLKSKSGYIQFGRITGDYAFDAAETDPHSRHYRPVEWLGEPIPRAAIDGDLLSILGAYMTVFSPSRNGAAERLEAIASTGTDPGAPEGKATSNTAVKFDDDNSDVTDPDPVANLESIRDRVRAHVAATFREHRLTDLVADILRVMGFHCVVSPPGPDGGVDILAGRGPLGLDAPTLIVEVKSEPRPIDVKVVRGLHSAMVQHSASQGLLVAWGGITGPAANEFKQLRTSFRIWDAEALLDKLFETYERLPHRTRQQIPLRQVWVLDDEEAND